MTDSKISDLPQLITAAAADLLHIVDDPSGTPTNKKIEVSDLLVSYKRTAAEIAAAVVPVNLRFEPGDVRRYGAVGDGIADDTLALQNALDGSAGDVAVRVVGGIYLIDAEFVPIAGMVPAHGLEIPSNCTMIFEDGALLQAKTTSSDAYIVMDIRGSSVVRIYDPKIIGDRVLHTGGTGEQGHCIDINTAADDIQIFNPNCTDAWGDGIAVRSGTNLRIHNAFCDNNRRNNITVNAGEIVFTGRTLCRNANGTAPEAGFDIEPNDALTQIDILIDNLITDSNVGAALTVNLSQLVDDGVDHNVSIRVNNHKDTGSLYGFTNEALAIGVTDDLGGFVWISNQNYTETKSLGMYIQDWGATNTPRLIFDHPNILNPNADNTATVLFGSGIGVDRKASSGLTTDFGNFEIINPTIVDNRTTNQMIRGVVMIDNAASGANIANAIIIDPIEISGFDADASFLNAIASTPLGLVVTDKHQVATQVITGDFLYRFRMYSKFITTDSTKRTITDATNSNDQAEQPLEIESRGTGGVKFIPKTGRAVFPLSTVAGKFVESTDVGARLVIKYDVTDDDWYIHDIVGSWSVEP